ncbi:glycopeptide antibiotics resistance protein [Paenibacillus endophyticus]|uniref:Glycopeptide antibiotics resistance protein n=1 Tax=Paenibacillus endophyticus TaxID=1294268 RepID=A0A7W5CAG6_9BACL|nr:glycopeptide antibiotics resistance protein [Paenibacillus endophyticus]
MKMEYIDKGLQENDAEKCAVYDFGDAVVIHKGMEKSLHPFKKVYQLFLWFSFIGYIGIGVLVLFIGKYSRIMHEGFDEGVTLSFDWGNHFYHHLIPFKQMDREIYQSVFWVATRNAFDITFFSTAIGVGLLFIPLGFFFPLLFKVSAPHRIVIYSCIIGATVEWFQYLTHTGMLNVNDMIYYASGAFFGWFMYFCIGKLQSKRSRQVIA